MPRTGNNIYKRKDGRWEGRYIKEYTADGKAKYGYVYAKTYAEVKTKLSIAISEKSKKVSKPSVNYLFSEIAEKWLARIKLECKISTYNKYRNNYEKQLKPVLGKYPISKISNDMIENFVAYAVAICGTYSTDTPCRVSALTLCLRVGNSGNSRRQGTVLCLAAR